MFEIKVHALTLKSVLLDFCSGALWQINQKLDMGVHWGQEDNRIPARQFVIVIIIERPREKRKCYVAKMYQVNLS